MRCILCEVNLVKLQRRQTCPRCEQRTRSTLRQIMDAAALLPAVLAGGTAGANDRVSGSRDLPMPGGDALVILGPGRDVRGATSDETRGLPEDERPDDPQSLAAMLGTWEDDWREKQDHRRRVILPDLGKHITAAYRYLTASNYWAAEHDSDYGDYASELREMLHQMERLLSTHGYVERLPIPCPDCGGKFIRPNGAAYVKCTDCRRRWPDQDYRRLTVIIIAERQKEAS